MTVYTHKCPGLYNKLGAEIQLINKKEQNIFLSRFTNKVLLKTVPRITYRSSMYIPNQSANLLSVAEFEQKLIRLFDGSYRFSLHYLKEQSKGDQFEHTIIVSRNSRITEGYELTHKSIEQETQNPFVMNLKHIIYDMDCSSIKFFTFHT